MATISIQSTPSDTSIATTPPVWRDEHVVEGRRFVQWYAQDVLWRDYPGLLGPHSATKPDSRYPFATKKAALAAYARKHDIAAVTGHPVYYFTHVYQHHRRLPQRITAFAVSVADDRVEIALPNRKRTKWVPVARIQTMEVTA